MNKDAAFLQHILDETQFILKNCEGLELQDLMNDDLLQRACLRSLEVIGEAVKNVSEDLKTQYPDLEWKKIAGLRDKLIHHYFGIDWDIVWNVITNRLPLLEDKIKKLIEKEFRI
ncbi:hypothetical protein C5S29_10185 [ANME-1 cluster archaeon GoMg3.2]|nr:hypothetical protein [ANME-1 cluster archaeon GoMg3.2]